jgi:regulator of protease activity HflC (stomatin/prohibitin superfamily)
MDQETKFWGCTITGTLFLLMLCGAATMYGCPKYKVWEQGLAGQAELRRAEQNRQVAIEEARAKRQSAVELAQAEVERAKGVAEANRIIGSSLHGNEDYLRYLWIQSLETTAAQGDKVIYMPTEASLPILEANRLKQAESTP